MIKENILQTIGSTPMVRINALNPNPRVNIYAKIEGFNPTGSIKDRIALRMVEQAEREGRLVAGMTILEPTSGNTGIGLAVVGIVKGYDVVIVMSEAVSVERRKILRACGAKVILTPAAEGTDGAIRPAREMYAAHPELYFMPDQFANAANYMAHYERTAIEIWQACGGQSDYFVSAVGTSGTLMGVSRFLRIMKPDIPSPSERSAYIPILQSTKGTTLPLPILKFIRPCASRAGTYSLPELRPTLKPKPIK
jgi:cysteine synthase B